MAEQDNKTEKATDRRKRQAREKGQVALSREIPTAVMLLAGLAIFYMFFQDGVVRLGGVMRYWLTRASGTDAMSRAIEPDEFRYFLIEGGQQALQVVFPVMVGMLLVGVASYVVQTKMVVKGLKIEWGKLNPFSGLKRMVSLRAVVELVKALLKIVVITGVGYMAVRHDLPLLPGLSNYDLWSVMRMSGMLLTKMAFWIGLTIAVIAVLDYAYQHYEWAKNLRMSKEEIKEEHKETEGDPLLRSRVRSLQREISRNRMMAAVPKADVVVTNPTHVAVALRYDPATMSAPILVAKGSGFMAEQIRKIAGEHGVKVIENKFVAQSLFRLVDVGREIPSDLFRAVAEILALVFRARGQTVLA